MRKYMVPVLTVLLAVSLFSCLKNEELPPIPAPEKPRDAYFTLSSNSITVSPSSSEADRTINVSLHFVNAVPVRVTLSAEDENGSQFGTFKPSDEFFPSSNQHQINFSWIAPSVDDFTGTINVRIKAFCTYSDGVNLSFFSPQITVSGGMGRNNPPVAVLDYTPDSPLAGQEVVLDASESYDPDEDAGDYITKYCFSIDSSPYQCFTNPYYTVKFSSAGTHQATLKVYDTRGAYGATSVLIEVQ